jgi:hypothetical protein
MKEPVDPHYKMLKGNIVYTLPDGTTTVWLNEYTDALVKAETERIVSIVKGLERHTTHSQLCYREHRFVERLLDVIEEN